jgi:hypothetical protein
MINIKPQLLLLQQKKGILGVAVDVSLWIYAW